MSAPYSNAILLKLSVKPWQRTRVFGVTHCGFTKSPRTADVIRSGCRSRLWSVRNFFRGVTEQAGR